MRVLCVGGIQYKNAASRFYDVTQKIMNGFIREGHTVLYFSDRDVSRANNLFRSRKMGVLRCNKEFVKVVESFMPELIVFKHADVISPEAINFIKESYPLMKMVQLNVDALFNPDNVNRIRSKSGILDATFVTTAGNALEKIKVNDKPIYFIPNPVDASIETGRSFEEVDLSVDAFFAMGGTFDGDFRNDYLKQLAADLPQCSIRLFVSSLGYGIRGAAYYSTLADSKCGLNLSRKAESGREALPEDLYLYSSDRIAQYVGNGLLTFTDKDFSLNKLFTEDEMVFYSGYEDLREKLKYYLDNPKERQRIAKNGWKKAHRAYNERQCAKFILEAAFGDLNSTFEWDTSPV